MCLDKETKEIIDATVEATVSALKAAGLISSRQESTYRKTEELLRNYNALTMSGDPTAEELVRKIETALEYIKDDPYYETVTLYYIGGWTREQVADRFESTVKTITRNKTRLINRLKAILYTEEYIAEMCF